MSNANAVWYAQSYHPVQAGSIDGTDVLPHDNAVYRAQLCSSLGLYDPFGDPKAIGDPYCTVFVGRLSRQTDEETLTNVMSKYGRVKNMRLVRDIVTGASKGYAFVEYETEREMRRAYEDAHHIIIDGNEVIVDYYRQQLMPGWIPRRLGGGLGGKKESGQIRFGGRERPFRAPLRPIPHDELKRLGIPPPPEGHYLSRHKIPSPPRRKREDRDKEEYSPSRHRSQDREDSRSRHRSQENKEDLKSRRKSHDREDSRSRRTSKDREESRSRHRSKEEDESRSKHRSKEEDESRLRHRSKEEGEPRSRHRSKEEGEPRSRHRSKDEDESRSRHRPRYSDDLGSKYESNYKDDFESGWRERSKDRGGSSHKSGYEHHREHSRIERSRDRSEDSKSSSCNKRHRSLKESQ